MDGSVNEVDVSQEEIERDLLQGLHEFDLSLEGDYSNGAQTQEPEPEPEPQINDRMIKEMLTRGLSQCFALINDRAFPNYAITKAENQALGESWAGVIDYYFPDLYAGPLLTAFAMTGLIYGDRAARGVPARIKEVKQEQASPAPADDLNNPEGSIHGDG